MIGEEIRAALARKRWSIARAAKESGVERTFLSRLVNGSPPPRVKKGRQTAEIDPRYRRLAEALDIPNPGAFIQEVIAAQASPLAPELSEQQKAFLRHLWGRLNVDPEYKADISALLNYFVRATGSPYKAQRLRRLFFETFKPLSPSISISRSSGAPSFLIGQHQSGKYSLDELLADTGRSDHGNLSQLLEAIGDQVYTMQEEYAIDAQFEIAQLLFDLSRRVLTDRQALLKAVELAQQVCQS